MRSRPCPVITRLVGVERASRMRIVSYRATVILSSRRRIEKEVRRIIDMQPSLIAEVRKACERIIQRGSRKRDAVMSAMRKAPNALAAIAALTCACRVAAIWQNHLIPEVRRWRECGRFFVRAVVRAVCRWCCGEFFRLETEWELDAWCRGDAAARLVQLGWRC
jgi:hypothetical protein